MPKPWKRATALPHIFKMPGDTDGDFLLTQCDIDNLLHGAYEDTLSGDANHSGTADLSDAVYLAHLIQSVGHLSVQHALETEIPPIATATTSADALPTFWNSQIFQRQLAK